MSDIRVPRFQLPATTRFTVKMLRRHDIVRLLPLRHRDMIMRLRGHPYQLGSPGRASFYLFGTGRVLPVGVVLKAVKRNPVYRLPVL